MRRLVAALVGAAAILATAGEAQAAPPSPNYAFVHGRWWTGKGFRAGTFYTVEGMLRRTRPQRIDQVIDLHGGHVIPPLAEGHNHWLEPARIDQYNACYLADGVFYVRDMRNAPFVMDQIRDRVNLPGSVDFVTALQGFTGPGAHPIEIIDYFVGAGVFPRGWKRDYDPEALLIVRSEKDVEDRFRLLLAEHPAYVKAYLSYSEEYEKRRDDPAYYGNHRGMDPRLLPRLVELAHASGLRVAAHVYTVEDFRNALAAGVDDIAHVPAGGAEPDYGVEHFRLTPADAALARRRGVTVTTTVQDALDEAGDAKDAAWRRAVRDQAIIPNLRLLKRYGVPLLVGSDQFRRSPLNEVMALGRLGVFSNTEVLKMDTEATARATFPDRRIGRLDDGYEANFLVLARDPVASLDNLRSITLRVKQGRRIQPPAWAMARPGPDCVEQG